jgi:NADPH-dependent curcumin reductase CurA
MTTSTQIILAQTPQGPVLDSNFAHAEVTLPELSDGEFLVSVKYVSIDPTIRGWIAYDTYLPKIGEGEVIRSLGAGEIIQTNNDAYPIGSRVTGMTNWQSRVIMTNAFRIPDGVTYEDALSVMGMTGLTAYYGVLEIGKPKAGETVVVSGAAGAVGSLAGQIAKVQGARVVGLAGSSEKCDWVTNDLGFDACINYRAQDVPRVLRETCPEGIDVYFDNVGGQILNAALGQINDHARIVMCGAISGYDSSERAPGPANLVNVIPRRATLQGFIVLDHFDRAAESAAAMSGWMAEGKLTSKVDITDGLDNAPGALMALFTGGNTGKSLVRL